MKYTKLPDSITKIYFDCIEQQIMTLCLYFHKEFWKIFINQQLVYDDYKVEKMEDVLKYKGFIFQNAKKYYGISLIDMEKNEKLSFDNDEIYLIYMKLEEYPLTQELERKGTHALLIYGETKEEFIVNDNYCGVTEYLLKKEKYKNGIKSVKKVCCNTKKEKSGFNEFISTFSIPNSSIYQEGYNYIIENKIRDYRSATLIELINKISCMIKKDALMAEMWSAKEEFLEKSVQILDFLADTVRKNYYAILKAQLKYGKIPENLLMKIVNTVRNSLICEEKTKLEIINLLQNKQSIKDRLHKQVLSYLELEEFDDSASVYELHDHWSIIYLINYLEECNAVGELEYDDFCESISYLEFELVIYEKILLKDMSYSNSTIEK